VQQFLRLHLLIFLFILFTFIFNFFFFISVHLYSFVTYYVFTSYLRFLSTLTSSSPAKYISPFIYYDREPVPVHNNWIIEYLKQGLKTQRCSRLLLNVGHGYDDASFFNWK
jgi:hypothetical protein